MITTFSRIKSGMMQVYGILDPRKLNLCLSERSGLTQLIFQNHLCLLEIKSSTI